MSGSLNYGMEISKEDLINAEVPEGEEVDESDLYSELKIKDVNAPLDDLLGALMRQNRNVTLKDPPKVKGGLLYGQDFQTIKAECLEAGKLWTDPDFPPEIQSLYFSENAPMGFEWKRASEISDNPKLFDDGASRFDINQGELGDCWLLAALANLTMNKKFLYRVVPLDQSFSEEYAGVFHIKFWQFGEWVDVVIDDYLPTRFGKLMLMHSASNDEFWTALLEKAYAKLNGSYEALKGGTTLEGLVDFTGGCSEMYQLKEKDVPSNLFEIMLKAYDRCSMMGCSMEPDPNVLEARTSVGLVRGHAYSITKVVNARIETPQASGKIPLIRIRNPWGNEAEWNGAWSDGSGEWQFIPDEEKENLGLNFKDDGEFWMSYKDFRRYWDQLEICNLTPDSLQDLDQFSNRSQWEVTTFPGAWVNGESAGGCRNFIHTFASNPQIRFTLQDPDEDDDDDMCTVVLSLMQVGRRALRDRGKDVLTVGYGLYYLRDPSHEGKLDTRFFQTNRSVGRSKAFINLREVSTRFRLPVGTYVLVPSTFHPNEEAEFIVRILTEKSAMCEQY